ncbi:hypothetical protein [Cardiobacterium hominis]|uniref:hypothetical protein n=1 Tax=Cardiobacterium hominis TaxID=2718 RepID=UPI0024907025|nr:hypothetical protein [Cardiobacterium hominis]
MKIYLAHGRGGSQHSKETFHLARTVKRASRDTPREMMASLTVAEVREQMPEQVVVYPKRNPAPIWMRWSPICTLPPL